MIEMSGLPALLVDLIIVATTAVIITVILAFAGRSGRPNLWIAAAVVGAVALLLEWLLPFGIPLTHEDCGPLCGRGRALMPAAAAFSAVGAGGVLSVRHRWAPQRLRRALAFIVCFLILLGGVRLWVALV